MSRNSFWLGVILGGTVVKLWILVKTDIQHQLEVARLEKHFRDLS